MYGAIGVIPTKRVYRLSDILSFNHDFCLYAHIQVYVRMTLCQDLWTQEGTAGGIESMQQSSATLKNMRHRDGVAEDCCSQLSAFLYIQFWHSVFPTSRHFYTCIHRQGSGPCQSPRGAYPASGNELAGDHEP